jgi:hypothetical protein|tara:strand:- start:137 stop:304 length:168 start_codon:yes stop_codon:yes gene_type:complete
MVEPIRYGAGGIPMVNQEPPKVEPVEKISKDKKQKQPLQEIYGDDGFDEEHGDKE